MQLWLTWGHSTEVIGKWKQFENVRIEHVVGTCDAQHYNKQQTRMHRRVRNTNHPT